MPLQRMVASLGSSLRSQPHSGAHR